MIFKWLKLHLLKKKHVRFDGGISVVELQAREKENNICPPLILTPLVYMKAVMKAVNT